MARARQLSLLVLGSRAVATAARAALVVAPADRQVVAAAAGEASLSLILDRRRAKVCVVPRLAGREPTPEACLENVASIDVFRVPVGEHAFALRDANSGEAETLRVVVRPTKPGEFVPTRSWQTVTGDSVPPGLDVRLPLDGAAKEARIPDAWRLQLWAAPPGRRAGFFRTEVRDDTTVRSLEAELGRWAGTAALLGYRDARPFHADATAAALGLFLHQRDLVVRWPDEPAAEAASTPKAPAASAEPARPKAAGASEPSRRSRPQQPPPPKAPAMPVAPTGPAASEPVRLTRPKAPAATEAVRRATEAVRLTRPSEAAEPVRLTRPQQKKTYVGSMPPIRVVRPPAGYFGDR